MGHVPSPRLLVPGRRCEGQSQLKRSPGHSSPRYVHNPRPPRRTRRSVRPAPCRVSDRTMVRVVRPRRFEQSNGPRSRNEGTMRSKTDPSTRKNSKASSRVKTGLTAKSQRPKQSVGTESALDSRSHRTYKRSTANTHSSNVRRARERCIEHGAIRARFACSSVAPAPLGRAAQCCYCRRARKSATTGRWSKRPPATFTMTSVACNPTRASIAESSVVVLSTNAPTRVSRESEYRMRSSAPGGGGPMPLPNV